MYDIITIRQCVCPGYSWVQYATYWWVASQSKPLSLPAAGTGKLAVLLCLLRIALGRGADLSKQGANMHDDVIKWKHFPRYWPFVRGIHRSTVNSPHKGQRRGALMFSLIHARIDGWVNNGEAGDLRRHHTNYDVTLMGRAILQHLF